MTLSNGQTNSDYQFWIELVNPCKSATLNLPTIADMSVDDGATATQTFSDAGDSVSSSLSNISFCGSRTFTITDTTDNSITWMSVTTLTGSSYTISA